MLKRILLWLIRGVLGDLELKQLVKEFKDIAIALKKLKDSGEAKQVEVEIEEFIKALEETIKKLKEMLKL